MREWEQQFVEYFRARAQALRRLGYALCGDWHSADDLIQVTFVRLYRSWPRIHTDSIDVVSEDEPPMGLTTAEVLAAGRRSRRRYRLATAGGVAAVALAVTGTVVLPQALRPSEQPPAKVAGASPFGALAPCPTPPGARPGDAVDPARPLSPAMAAWATGSVTCALADLVPRLLPHARFAAMPRVHAGPLEGFILGGKPPWGNRVDAHALVRNQEGTGYLDLSVAVSSAGEAQGAVASCEEDEHCTVSDTRPGVTLLVDEIIPSFPEDAHFIGVDVYQGLTHVHVQLDNTDMHSVNGLPPAPTRGRPVLTVDQAVDLALSPRLYLFP